MWTILSNFIIREKSRSIWDLFELRSIHYRDSRSACCLNAQRLSLR